MASLTQVVSGARTILLHVIIWYIRDRRFNHPGCQQGKRLATAHLRRASDLFISAPETGEK
jgi:hypothetical protein